MQAIFKLILPTILLFNSYQVSAQVLTAEDSLQAGLSRDKKSLLSGYGEAYTSNNFTTEQTQTTLKRNVLFIGYKFNKNISLFSELEMEDALSAPKGKGLIAMEQAFIKLNFHPNHYFIAGLFVPRFGITNENHLSTTFNSVKRPFVETEIIPTTWREIGIAYYGQIESLDNLYISASIQNGLSSEKFSINTGIRDGRQFGSAVVGNNLSHNISALYYKGNSRFQVSQYYGGSSTMLPRVADSVGLSTGLYKNAVAMSEANYQYMNNKWQVKILGVYGSIKNAQQINKVYSINAPSSFAGYNAELAYNLAPIIFNNCTSRKLNAFVRYEYSNTNLSVPSNGIHDPRNNKKYYIAGLCYKPVQGIAIKFDYVRMQTGEKNPDILVDPFPKNLPYNAIQNTIQLGIAYNF